MGEPGGERELLTVKWRGGGVERERGANHVSVLGHRMRRGVWPAGPGPAATLTGAASLFFSVPLINLVPTMTILCYIQGGTELCMNNSKNNHLIYTPS